MQGASVPGVTSGACSESPRFLFPLLAGYSTSTLLLKPVPPLGLGQRQQMSDAGLSGLIKATCPASFYSFVAVSSPVSSS